MEVNNGKNEFKQILNYLGIAPHVKLRGMFNGKEYIYKFTYKHLSVQFNDSGYATIIGMIPGEVARTIHYKYPQNQLGIYSIGDLQVTKPVELFLGITDRQYEKETKRIESIKPATPDLFAYMKNQDYKRAWADRAFNKFLKRNNLNKYVKKARVDTREGLIVLLTELKKYFNQIIKDAIISSKREPLKAYLESICKDSYTRQLDELLKELHEQFLMFKYDGRGTEAFIDYLKKRVQKTKFKFEKSFILEIIDAFNDDNTNELEVPYDGLNKDIASEVLATISPEISLHEYAKINPNTESEYLLCYGLFNCTPFGQELRPLLDAFDIAVNPYTDKSLTLDDINNYTKRISINGFADNPTSQNNTATLTIRSLETANHTKYQRKEAGFSSLLEYRLEDGTFVRVEHFYNAQTLDAMFKGEGISIKRYGKNNKEPLSSEETTELVYNFDTNTYRVIYKNKGNHELDSNTQQQQPNDELRTFILNSISEALEYAKETTISNMIPRAKKLT